MALTLTGTCTCKKLQYTVKLDSADSARTSLCHCSSCKKAFGTNYGLTSKVRIRPPLAMSPRAHTAVLRYFPYLGPNRELQIQPRRAKAVQAGQWRGQGVLWQLRLIHV